MAGLNFLAPLFLAGAAAVALPILFHLIRRTTKDQVWFSSLRFLTPSLPRVTRRSRIEHWLLLLLRCAVLVGLALAFARPFFAGMLAPARPAADVRRIAILVDTSASMQRTGLWDRTRQRAMAAAREARNSDRVALFAFGEQVRPLVSFDEASRDAAGAPAMIEARLAAVAPGWEATHLGNALTTAAELLVEDANRSPDGELDGTLVVFTDLQSGAKLDGLQGYEWPKGLQVRIETILPEDPANASLALLPTESGLLAATNILPRARLQNAGGAKDQFQVSWMKDGLPTGPIAEIYVPGGESRIFTPPAMPAGAQALKLLNDPEAFDNTAWWIPPDTGVRWILYAGPEIASDSAQPLYYVRRAFEQDGLPFKVQQLGRAPATNAEPSRPELMIVTDVLSGPGLEAAGQLLAAGKTVLFAPRSANAARTLAPLLGVPALTATDRTVPGYALLGQIDFTHPLLRLFADARYSDFTKIHFWKYRLIDFSPVTNAVVAARFDNGDPFLVEIPRERGRVVALTSTWSKDDSRLGLSSKFVPLLLSLVDQGGLGESAGRLHRIGDAVRLARTNMLAVIRPDGTEAKAENGVFGATELPGIYRAGPPETERFAVNLDPAEGRTAPLPVEELSSMGVPLQARQISEKAAALAQGHREHLLATELESRQKMWRKFVWAALALLFVECWMAGRLSWPAATQASA